MTALRTKLKVSGSVTEKKENTENQAYFQLALSKQIPVVYSADRGLAEKGRF